MGYTHYWNVPDDDAYDEAWPQIVEDTRKIAEAVAQRGIVLANWNGNGTPTIDNGGISFNGDARTDKDYESFVLAAPGESHGFAFCKTGMRPYDLAVTAVLLRAHMLAPSLTISSDGDWDDWTEARNLVADLFGDVPIESPFGGVE